MKGMQYLMGIDIGSSAVKVALFDTEGALHAACSQAYATQEPQPRYKEQDPKDWWEAVKQGTCSVMANVPASSLLAVGVAGHISSMTFIGTNGQLIRPSLGYQDGRASAEVSDLYEEFTREELAAQLGIDLPPAPTWPLPRLLWFKKHEPATLTDARYLLQAKDYVNFKLTGEFASDSSSNRGMVNFKDDSQVSSILAALGLPDLLPPLYAPQHVIGAVSAGASAETGIAAGVSVIAGWNDLNACVLGSGVLRADECFNVTGTSDHIGVVTAGTTNPPELMCAPYLPGRRLLYGVMSNGGGSLQWLSQLSGQPIDRLIALPRSNSDDLLFLPYLNGERSPIWDSNASGVFLGLRTAHGLGDLAHAVMQGVAFSLRQNLELVEQHASLKVQTVVVSGGAARLQTWNRIKADVLSKRIVTQKSPHAGILGIAVLAAVATGVYPTIESAAESMIHTAALLEPREDLRPRANRMFDIYKRSYPALRDIFTDLSAINQGEFDQ